MSNYTAPSEDFAIAAYKAYGEAVDFKNYQGLPMPVWDELPEKIRLAWLKAARAAADAYMDYLKDTIDDAN